MATVEEAVTGVSDRLAAHEAMQKDRYEHLESKLKEIKHAVKDSKTGDETMSEVRNIFETNPMSAVAPYLMNQGGGTGAALGGGLGAGLLGGVLGTALLGNRNGLLGNNGDAGGGFVTPTQFQAGLNSVTEANNTSTVLQTLGDIKTGVASIPTAVALAEGQTQIALQNAQADLNRSIDSTGDQISAQVSAAQLANANNFAATSRQLSDIIATSLASQNNINVNVLQSAAATREAINLNGTANLIATKDAATATALAVANSTKEILAALNAQDMANLQRQLTVAETTLAEQRSAARSREIEVNVSQTVTQNQNQLQLQSQSQQQFQILAQLAASVGNLANDIQTVKQGSVVFNSGRMMDSGNQSAANTSVRG